MTPDRPEPDDMLKAAWTIRTPAIGPALRAGYATLNGAWPDIARMVLDWERQGLRMDQIDKLVAAAETAYQPTWAAGNEPTPYHRPGYAPKVDISKLKI